MLKNYILIAIRNFSKHRIYSLLNIMGLAVSLAVAALILLYIRHEQSYDAWVPNAANLYRVYREWDGGGSRTAWTPPPLSQTLREQFPEVKSATRISGFGEALLATQENKSLYAKQVALVDSSLLHVLPLPLEHGDSRTALDQPYTAVLTDELSQKLYGDENPVGKTLRFNNNTDYKITGVLAPPAGKTHLEWEIYLNDPDAYFPNWTGNSPQTYVSLHEHAHVAQLEKKVTKTVNEYIKKELVNMKASFDKLPDWRFQPFADIHLHSSTIGGPFQAKGDYQSLLVFSAIAIIILIIASINYMNLATAQAAKRAKEVGVRKVTGATSQQLIVQFLTESTLQSLLALPLAIVLAALFLPAFNVVINRNLVLGLSEWSVIGAYLVVLVIILGLISGSYPAFFLSAYKPTDVLKGTFQVGTRRGVFLRRSLVVTQFAMAIAVAIVMSFIYMQVRYMQDQELGFHSGQVLVIRLHTMEAPQRIQAIKSQLLQNPRIESVTYTTSLPGRGMSDYGFQIEGVEKDPSVNIYFTEPDFIKTLGLQLVQGRFFSYDHPSDTSGVFVVNEAFVKTYNIKNPIGHRMRFPNKPYGTIIGVVKDFHYKSLQSDIEPLVLYGNVKYHGGANYAAVRLSSQDIRSTVDAVNKAWKEVEPAHPMQYTFLDEDFAQLYNNQTRLGQTLLYTTFLTIFIALLGLFGLASFMAEQRVKEIGVRKVLGASVSQIVLLLGKDFLKLVLIAGLIATPLALWITREWLTNFAYQISISASPFILAILASLLVAALTVSGRAIKAALMNPVKSLRNE